jgi:hypothetical protein
MFISRGEPLVRRPAVVKAAEATRSTREAVAPPCRKPPEFWHRESISQKPRETGAEQASLLTSSLEGTVKWQRRVPGWRAWTTRIPLRTKAS